MTRARQKLWLAGSCLLGIVVFWHEIDVVDGSEFIGGRLTSRRLLLAWNGVLLFLLGWVLTVVRRRVAAGFILTASLLCWPLCLYMTFPAMYRRVFKGEYSVPLQSRMTWDWWAIAGMLTQLLSMYVCLRIVSVGGQEITSSELHSLHLPPIDSLFAPGYA
jgi:hypothetical protein